MNTAEFTHLVDQRTQSACFAQGAQAMLDFASCYLRALDRAQRAAQPTPESQTATRQAMGRSGLAPLLSRRPKLTAAQRREIEAAETAKRLGIYRGSVRP